MENMFKRTLLGAAIATAAMASTGANAAIDLLDGKVQMYGQAAGGLIIANPDGGESNVTADIESRIGFRGKVEFDNLAPDLIWQMEGGNANNGTNTGGLGARDTFLGLDFDGVGSIKFGRQLVAAYNYVDWPHSNPGIGGVFDWNNDIGASYEDRADNVIRFDSANFGGFNFQATASGMKEDADQVALSFGTSYTADMYTVHGGYYTRSNLKNEMTYGKDGVIKTGMIVTDNSYGIVGGALYLGDITLTAAAKYMMTETEKHGDMSQMAYSATAQYIAGGTWLYKLGVSYAETPDLDSRNTLKVHEDEMHDLAVTGRIGYLLPSAILYADVRYSDHNRFGAKEPNSSDTNANGVYSNPGKATNVHLGVEYYF
ncbi:porin [Photobacterium leiognathi]|uniref:porin n=1 Tax=Photobacterium leiognathi TaxID=553611 RepID=UPI0029820FD9|nr:porin [Photobacterium leiognathi]